MSAVSSRFSGVRHLSWFLLALSVLFNVFFAAGYARARTGRTDAMSTATNATPVTEDVAGALSLDEQQRAVFAALRDQFDSDAADLETSIAIVQQQFMDEIQRPSPDLERLRELAARRGEFERECRVAAGSRLRDFITMLSPEQRSRLAHHLGRDAERARRHRWLMEEFDADGDGTLDDAEREAAQEAMEERRAERSKREAELIERFDADGDGTLNESERAALRKYWAERRRTGGRSHGQSGRGGRSDRHGGDGPRGPRERSGGG